MLDGLAGAGTEAFNYSARGLTNYVDALGTNTFYGYDTASRLITITNGNGETNLFQYDATGRDWFPRCRW